MSEIEDRLHDMETELDNLKAVYQAREQVLYSLLNRVAQCEAMAGIQPNPSNAAAAQPHSGEDGAQLNNEYSPGTGSLSLVD